MNNRQLAFLIPLLLLGALASAAPSRPDVRRLNDGKQLLRVGASPSAKTLDALVKGEPFLVLETGTGKASVDGATGTWLKVRSFSGQEGFLLSGVLDRPRGAYFKGQDFPSPELFEHYLALALRRGERVRAREAYDEVEAGDLGWFVSWGEDDPPFLVVWDRDLEATPLDSAIDLGVPRILEDRMYFVHAEVLEATGEAETADISALAQEWAELRAPEFMEGSRVSLGAHLQVDVQDKDSTNWNEEMDQYVGEVATITEVSGKDPWGRLIVKVDIDDGDWEWRIENMRLEAATDQDSYYEDEDSSDEAALSSGQETYGRIALGSSVILGRHDEVNGETNWNTGMDRFVGTAAKVISLDESDDAGCLGVRVDGNSFFWRVRNLALKGRGEEGSYGFEVGDRVILGSHREINGDANWSEEMAEYVGQEAMITEIVGVEEGDSRCFLVAVDVDSGDWVWRVENMTPAP